MRHRFGITLTAFALTVAAALQPLTCAAQARLSQEYGGHGLRPQPQSAPAVNPPSGGEAKQYSQSWQPSEFTLFGGSRELTRGGLGPAEAYGGVAYSFSRGWGSSVEAAYTPGSLLAPRQYALTGEVRTALSDRKALSVGIKYRVYDADPGVPGDSAPVNGFGLAPSRGLGTGYAPGYQLQLGYQHSAFTLFGLALGRETESYAAAFDPAALSPRQLSFTGQHWLTPSWALSYDVLSGDLGIPNPTRLQGLGLRLGVRYRF
jgi:hypothetical protein